MMTLKIISIDMFQTLANLESRKYPLYRLLLGRRFTSELADRCWQIGIDALAGQFSAIRFGKIDYVPLREMFANCFRIISRTAVMDVDTDEAATLFSLQHAESPLFDDALEFLGDAGTRFPVCLASDTDAQMLGSLGHIYPFDHVFTSERLRAYKVDSQNRFFNALVDHYRVPPSTILHIGDAPADVIGAAAAGMTTCWLNRNSAIWRHKPQPDHEVISLMEVLRII